jgi:N-acylneuraminate cytidylyltransferase
MTPAVPLLAVIPARGNSKRVPGKNVRELHGKPAIQYTIEAALQSGFFESVIVSTDNDGIAKVATEAGAQVPFMRDAVLADDFTPVSAATLDALDRVDADSRYNAVCQLMANCPLRTAADIRDSYRQFSETGARAQISITEYGWLNPWWAMTADDSHRLTHLLPEGWGKRSQDLPPVFCPTGAVWWAKCDALRQEGTFHTSDKTGWKIPWYRAVDIDSEDDWKMAELLMLAYPAILTQER